MASGSGGEQQVRAVAYAGGAGARGRSASGDGAGCAWRRLGSVACRRAARGVSGGGCVGEWGRGGVKREREIEAGGAGKKHI